MDDYDNAHSCSYDTIIDIYSNDDIDSILLTVIGRVDEEIKKNIIQLRNALFILEYRYITNIGRDIFGMKRMIRRNVKNKIFLFKFGEEKKK